MEHLHPPIPLLCILHCWTLFCIYPFFWAWSPTDQKQQKVVFSEDRKTVKKATNSPHLSVIYIKLTFCYFIRSSSIQKYVAITPGLALRPHKMRFCYINPVHDSIPYKRIWAVPKRIMVCLKLPSYNLQQDIKRK